MTMQVQISTPNIKVWRIEEEFANVPHSHEDQFQITIPLYGQCFFNHENRSYVLSSGECLVQYPQDRHSFFIGQDSGVMILQVGRASMGKLGARGTAIEPSFRQRIEPVRALRGFRDWYGGLFSDEKLDRLAMEEIESKILFFLFRNLSGNHSISGTEAPIWSAAAGDNPHLSRVLAYIQESYAEALGIDELAALASQSRFHFIRSFKAFTGLSPYQYVLKIRIEKAKLELAGSNRTATDIGLDSGFASPSQFHRAFVKAVGMTPEQFRTSVRQP